MPGRTEFATLLEEDIQQRRELSVSLSLPFSFCTGYVCVYAFSGRMDFPEQRERRKRMEASWCSKGKKRERRERRESARETYFSCAFRRFVEDRFLKIEG